MKSIARVVVSLTLVLGLVSTVMADPTSKRPIAFDDVFRIDQRP